MKYVSKYSPNKQITPAQYIAEKVCENRAWSLGIELPPKFWDDPEWQKYYKYQIFMAHKLVKQIEPKYIVSALEQTRSFSLKNPVVMKVAKSLKAKDLQHKSEKSLPKVKKVQSFGALRKSGRLFEELD